MNCLRSNQIISEGLRGEEVRDPSKYIKAKDWEIMRSILQLATYLRNFPRKNSWMRIWDNALDKGPTSSLAALKLLSAPVYGDRRCILHRCHLLVDNTDTMIAQELPPSLTQTHSLWKSTQNLTPFLTWGSLFYQPYSEPPSTLVALPVYHFYMLHMIMSLQPSPLLYMYVLHFPQGS